jgi:hypothetical protein
MSMVLIRLHQTFVFQIWGGSFIDSHFWKHMIHTKVSNSCNTSAVVKSINIGAGEGNFYEETPGVCPYKNKQQQN